MIFGKTSSYCCDGNTNRSLTNDQIKREAFLCGIVLEVLLFSHPTLYRRTRSKYGYKLLPRGYSSIFQTKVRKYVTYKNCIKRLEIPFQFALTHWLYVCYPGAKSDKYKISAGTRLQKSPLQTVIAKLGYPHLGAWTFRGRRQWEIRLIGPPILGRLPVIWKIHFKFSLKEISFRQVTQRHIQIKTLSY